MRACACASLCACVYVRVCAEAKDAQVAELMLALGAAQSLAKQLQETQALADTRMDSLEAAARRMEQQLEDARKEVQGYWATGVRGCGTMGCAVAEGGKFFFFPLSNSIW